LHHIYADTEILSARLLIILSMARWISTILPIQSVLNNLLFNDNFRHCFSFLLSKTLKKTIYLFVVFPHCSSIVWVMSIGIYCQFHFAESHIADFFLKMTKFHHIIFYLKKILMMCTYFIESSNFSCTFN
jgi:hypothetical protein